MLGFVESQSTEGCVPRHPPALGVWAFVHFGVAKGVGFAAQLRCHPECDVTTQSVVRAHIIPLLFQVRALATKCWWVSFAALPSCVAQDAALTHAADPLVEGGAAAIPLVVSQLFSGVV